MFGINTVFSSSFVSSAPSVPPGPATVAVTGSPPIDRTDNGDYWVYTFLTTSVNYSMQFSNVTTDITLNCLAVAGGGGGAGYGGGGGAGGMVETIYTVSSSQSINITVGAGGAGGARGSNGANTRIGTTITAKGGGGGGGGDDGGSGGRGGGAGAGGGGGGLGTTGQGNKGGDGGGFAGGGGGAFTGGADGTSTAGGAGGLGKPTTLAGIPSATYATGGSGYNFAVNTPGGANTGNGGGYKGNYESYPAGSGIVQIAILKSSIV